MPSIAGLLSGYDFNLPLTDALNDPAISPDRRALAAVSMRQGLDDAYFNAHGLLEAFIELETDARLGLDLEASSGARAVEAILLGDGDDYQRRLYWILSEVDVADAVSDMIWLTELLRGRAAMYRALGDTGTRMRPVPDAG